MRMLFQKIGHVSSFFSGFHNGGFIAQFVNSNSAVTRASAHDTGI